MEEIMERQINKFQDILGDVAKLQKGIMEEIMEGQIKKFQEMLGDVAELQKEIMDGIMGNQTAIIVQEISKICAK